MIDQDWPDRNFTDSYATPVAVSMSGLTIRSEGDPETPVPQDHREAVHENRTPE